MKIDVILQPGTDPAEAILVGQKAEEFGLHAVWASSFPGQRDPFQIMAAVAVATSQIRLGVMPISPWEIHPVKLRDTLYTLNDISQGRAQLLVGAMGKSVMNATGMQPQRRVRAVTECVQILKNVALDKPLDCTGEIFSSYVNALPWSRHVAPRIYVAADGPQMLRLTGSVADGLMLSDITPEHLPGRLQEVDIGVETSARRARPWVNNFWAWHVKRNKAEGIQEARQELVWRGALQRSHISQFLNDTDCNLVAANWHEFLNAFRARTHVIHNVPERIVQSLVDGLTFSGGIEDIAAIASRIRELEIYGQNEIALRLHRDPLQAVELIGKYLVPELQVQNYGQQQSKFSTRH